MTLDTTPLELADWLLAAEIETHILIEEEDSVRDDWWRASCGLHDWYTTGSQPNVEDAAAMHVAWGHPPCKAADPDSPADAPLRCRLLPGHADDHFNGGRNWTNDRTPAEFDAAPLTQAHNASHYFATDKDREGFLTLFGDKLDTWFTPEFVHYLRHGVYPTVEQSDGSAVLTDARLDEIDRCFGAGGSYTGAPTKQDLRTALIELVDEVRRERRAARDAVPARLPHPDYEDCEAEKQRLQERADQADLEAAQASLRASVLHLVLQSVLLRFGGRRRMSRNKARSSWVDTATLARWWRVCDDKGRTAEQALEGAGSPAAIFAPASRSTE